MTRIGKSDSQANAEALARRSSTYADEHAASWSVRFDRPSHEPKGLRGYVRELRDAYEAECPTRLHSHDLDSGGAPAFTKAFEAYLDGSPFALDKVDQAYTAPFRAALASMHRSQDPRTQSRARIAWRIVNGTSTAEATAPEGIPEMWADVVARDALRVTWRRVSSAPLPQQQREVAA